MSTSSQPSFGRLAVPAAQAIGLTTSAFLSGFGFAFSYVSIPVIAQTCPASHMAKQWLATFELGKATAPPMAILSAICFGYLASTSRDRKGFFPEMSFDPTAPWALYTAAALLLPCIMPYTLIVMAPTTLEPLIKAASDATYLSPERTLELLQLWKEQNYARQAFGLVGTALAAIATVM